jgi:hypothetical protein
MQDQKKITVRMLEAYFNSMPTLVEYMQRKAKVDPSANRALKNFSKEIQQERPFILDQSEAVFGFAAMLSQLDPPLKFGAKENAAVIAELASAFCQVNELTPPSPGYHNRLRVPKVGKMLGKEDE